MNKISKNPITDKLSFTERLSFALGEVPGAANSIVAAFIMFYYTQNVGMSGVMVGTMLLISKLFDGVTDLLAGGIIDKTRTKWGKARPWLLWLAIPTGISLALMFMVPAGASDTFKIVYAFLTYNLFMTICYTVAGCAKSSLMALMTQNSRERGILAQFAMISGLCGGILGCSVTIPFVTKLSGGEMSNSGWRLAFIIYGVIVTASMLLSFAFSREYVLEHKAANDMKNADCTVDFKEGMFLFFKNKYLLIAAFSSLMVGFSMQFNSTAQTFFYQENMGDLNLTASMNLLNLLPTVISIIVLPGICLKYLGKKKSLLIGAAGQIIGYFLRAIAATVGGVSVLAIGTVICGLGAGPLSCIANTLAADAVDYGESRFGKRIEGLGSSVMTFASKITGGLGAAFVGWIVGEGSNISKSGIALSFGYLPALFLIADIVVITLFYHYEEDYKKITDIEIKETKEVKEVKGAVAAS